MDLIDEKGRLFGLINVIDAVAVFLVLSLLVVGIAFATDDGSPPQELDSRNVTLDLGSQPSYVVTAIDVGDSYSPSANANLTVLDLHLSPQGSETRVIVLARLSGVATDGSIEYNGAPPRLGRELTIRTGTYNVSGTTRSVDDDFDTGRTDILLTTIVDGSVAEAIETGDTYRIGDHEVAHVDTVSVYGTEDADRKRIAVGLRLRTYDDANTSYFGSKPVQVSTELPFRTDSYGFSGTIERVGTTQQRGTPTTRTITVRLLDVRLAVDESIRPGTSESTRGDTIARITEVDREPVTVVLTDQGDIYERDHPVNSDLAIRAELSVRETTSGLVFKQRSLQRGHTIVLDLGSITIRATVVEL
ncbi:DUF4330 family protein [Salinigranum sp. GCM10025319]|uniref:DUF4330 family protein n=1 Tax=Salinigranum sp. GCM10025319 TaxID=3252687 RepID=UPI00361B6126